MTWFWKGYYYFDFEIDDNRMNTLQCILNLSKQKRNELGT